IECSRPGCPCSRRSRRTARTPDLNCRSSHPTASCGSLTMRLIQPEEWRPSGINDLELAAWNALRHAGSACVVAGPGAGKTEFLAQRADYLLETGLCRAPHRVLAISFKTDAANNL